MRYLLDTDICVYVISQRPPHVLEEFKKHEAAGLGISTVTAAELFYGMARTRSERNLNALQQFLAPLEIAPFDLRAAEIFGGLRAWLESQGTPIGPYDTEIAATALALGITLVSNNTCEYSRVPGLKLENWAG
jgi:tRNA(fMet)-specific endonuclease VapC